MGPLHTSRRSRGAVGLLLVLLVVVAAGCAGTRRWVSLYNGPLNFTDAPSGIAVGGNGKTVVVTGSSYGVGTLQDYATVAYDAVNGDRRWVARYNDSGNGDDAATSLALSPDSSKVFVTGRSESQPHSSANFVTVAYDVDNGGQLWIARDSRTGRGAHIVVSPDGTKVFVTGTVDSDYGTIAYDATNGSELWFARYNGPLNYIDGAAKITISPDGTTVYVSGSSAGSNAFADYATVAYNATNGAQKWVARYNGPGDSADDVTGLGISPDGTKVFVTGRSRGSTTSLDYATVAYSAATGTQQWAARYNGPANSDDGAYDLGVSPDGTRVFVTGYSFDEPTGSNGVAAATVAYNAVTGTQQWGTRYNGPDKYALALSLAVSPDGTKLFVIGSTSGGTATGQDYATVAYNTAVGTQQWAARYNGPTNSNDYGTAIAVSPDAKKVFVTGFTNEFIDEGFPPPTSPPTGPSQDYATVAYDAF